MSMKIYSVSGAPRAWRVLLGLAFKGLDYDIKLLEASKKEHKSSEYLKIHPRGTIPALEFEGKIHRDSIGILAWLDRQFPEVPLFGTTADEAANIWQVSLEACDYLREATNDVLFSIMVQGRPIAELDTEELQVKVVLAQKLKAECRWLESLLSETLYLAGDMPTAADTVCFPEIRLIERALDTKFIDMNALGFSNFEEEFPKLEAWKQRINKLPNVARTMPPHWSKTVQAA